jgi:hypothetical protein
MLKAKCNKLCLNGQFRGLRCSRPDGHGGSRCAVKNGKGEWCFWDRAVVLKAPKPMKKVKPNG